MDAGALQAALYERFRLDGWSNARMSMSQYAVEAKAERRGLNLVVRCLRPAKLVAVGELTHGDPCCIVAEVGDASTSHDRWAIWHDRRWTDADGVRCPPPLCPVAVGQGKYRATVATYGWPNALSGEGRTLSIGSIGDVMSIVEMLTSARDRGDASSHFDPTWSLSHWPTEVRGGAQRAVTVGGGATAGIGIAAVVATAATGAIPVAAIIAGAVVMPGLITALVGHSLMRDRRISDLVTRELYPTVKQSGLFNRHLRPVVATAISLPVLSATGAVQRTLAINTLMEAVSSKHRVRLRVSHWELVGEPSAKIMLLVPSTWACVELAAPEAILNRVEIPGAIDGEGTVAWLVNDAPTTTRTVRGIIVSLVEAIRGHAAGPYR